MGINKKYIKPQARSHVGFTIVELLIVIVVIGILAAISIVAYNNVQQKARDSQRLQDMKNISTALEMYYADHGEYPQSGGAASPSASWSNSQDGSWETLIDKLRPYVSTLPKDPINTTSGWAIAANTYNYAYYSTNNTYCSTAVRRMQMYIVAYRMEGSQKVDTRGDCTDNPLGPYGGISTLRVSK